MYDPQYYSLLDGKNKDGETLFSFEHKFKWYFTIINDNIASFVVFRYSSHHSSIPNSLNTARDSYKLKVGSLETLAKSSSSTWKECYSFVGWDDDGFESIRRRA